MEHSDPVAYKIRFFLWQCLQEVLPTAEVLAKHHFQTDPCCYLCKNEVESQMHLFTACPFGRAIWFAMELHSTLADLPHERFGVWLEAAIVKCRRPHYEDDIIQRCVITLWVIWLARNNARFEKLEQNPLSYVFQASRLLDKATQCSKSQDTYLKHRKRIEVGWLAPKHGWYKLNTDGASFGNPGPAAAGSILRDEMGAFVFGSSTPIHRATAVVAEFTALQIGLRTCLHLGYPKLWVEVDSQVVFHAIQGTNENVMASYEPILLDIRELWSQFHDITLTWNYREANEAADAFAKHRAQLASQVEWMANPTPHRPVDVPDFYNNLASFWRGRPPPFVASIVNKDMQGICNQR